jgi:hypothetical protein
MYSSSAVCTTIQPAEQYATADVQSGCRNPAAECKTAWWVVRSKSLSLTSWIEQIVLICFAATSLNHLQLRLTGSVKSQSKRGVATIP